MIDYLQPDFYRFNEDSLLLVNEIIALNIHPQSILDIGAGSGVIGIELAMKLDIPVAHFLELQRDWEPFLVANTGQFIPHHKIEIYWSSLGEWLPEIKYDLIVSNPPYYLPEKGRLSPDPVRAKCRTFLLDNWETLFQKSFMALNPGGRAVFVTAMKNRIHVEKMGKNFSLRFMERENVLLIELSSPE